MSEIDPARSNRLSRSTFSIAALIRVTVLVALTLAWVKLVIDVHPYAVETVVVLVNAVFAGLVGYRRCGRRWVRLRAAVLFFGGGVVLALYSGYVAQAVQHSVAKDQAWAALERLLSAFPVVVGLPIAGIVVVLMFRSWLWSAHDHAIRDAVAGIEESD